MVEIVRPPRLDRGLGLLSADSGPRQTMVERPGQDEIAQDEQDRRQTEPIFPPPPAGGAEDRVADNLGLDQPAHRTRRVLDMDARPVELRRVDRGQFDDRDFDRRAFGDELGP